MCTSLPSSLHYETNILQQANGIVVMTRGSYDNDIVVKKKKKKARDSMHEYNILSEEGDKSKRVRVQK